MYFNTEKEVWKDIHGYEKYYQVSSAGRVRSKDRVVKYRGDFERSIKGKVLSQSNVNGYSRVILSVEGKKDQWLVHRLVALAFHGRPGFKSAQVNHINSQKRDNRFDNLEWVTASENIIHSYEVGTSSSSSKRGEKHYRATLTRDDVLSIRRLYETGKYTQKEIGLMFGQSSRNIGKIVNRTNWKHV